MLELHLLGTVTLRCAGKVLPLPIRKTQALLLWLAIAGRQPRTRAVSLLWPALDESTGRRNLRRELARLREIGGGEVVQAEGDFLALGAAVSTDLQQLAQALAQGRHADALALWRGAAADGLLLDEAPAFLEWWQPEAERLRSLRQRTLAALATACEAAGDAEGALVHVLSQLADEPLQEQLHREAMRLHVLCGRREAALAQYERCHALLTAELGLAPMAETETLAATLRAGGVSRAPPAIAATPAAATPAAATPAAPQLPPLLPFVGRETEVAALELAWRAGRAVLIEGEGGLGKTRLATDFAAAHGPFAQVRARPGDTAVPYAAFARALRELAGPQPDFTALPRWAHAELARVLPELGPPSPPIRNAQERGRFVEACTQAWLLLAAESFDVVILDDWHHADHASAELLAFIAQRRREQHPASAREWLLLRPEMVAPLRQALQRLQAGADALHLPLAPLADTAVLKLVQRLSGVPEPRRFAARLGHATRGNPFFMAETLRHLAERALLSVASDGSWRTPFDEATDDYHELPVPRSVHEAVLGRVQRLPAAAQRVLEAAALAAEPFAPALLAPACALSELDAVLAIEQAVQAQLLREHEAGGYAFAHDLVQQALEAELPEARRRLVHRRLALAAEAAGGTPALIAAHHEASGERARAVAYRLAAGDAAARLHDLTQAIAHWQQGLADGPDAELELALRSRLARAMADTDRDDEGMAEAEALVSLAGRSALNEAIRVETLLTAASYLVRSGHAPRGLALLERLPAALPPAQQARRLNAHATGLREIGRVDEGLLLARQAAAVPGLMSAERLPLLDALVIAEHTAGRVHAALQTVGEAMLLSRRIGDDAGAARALLRRGSFLAESGDLAGAEADLLAAADALAALGHVSTVRNALFSLCCVYSAQTKPAQVLEVARRCWALQPAMPPSEMRLMVRLAFVDAHLALGQLGEAWAHAEPAVEEALAQGEPLAAIATCTAGLELLVWVGARAAAARLLAVLGRGVLQQMPQAAAEAWVVRVQSALVLGDTAEAAARLEELTVQPHDPRVRWRQRLAQAQLALAHGQAAAAVALMPAEDEPGANAELRVRALAVKVAAQASQGALDAGVAAAATAAMHAGAETHAFAQWQLLHALDHAAARGVAGVPPGAAERWAQERTLRAASLRAHPARHADFLRAWA